MSGLKTLKDIDSFVDFDSMEKCGIYSKGDLQDVAREWIKHLDNKIKIVMGLVDNVVNDENEDEYLTQLRVLNAERFVFKHFFNLEDEV
jgi:hypothetical protein